MALQTIPDIPAEVRAIVARKQISRSKIAAALNLTPMSISRRFNGEVAFTGIELALLAQLLEVPISELFGQTATKSTSMPGVSPDPGTEVSSFPKDAA